VYNPYSCRLSFLPSFRLLCVSSFRLKALSYLFILLNFISRYVVESPLILYRLFIILRTSVAVFCLFCCHIKYYQLSSQLLRFCLSRRCIWLRHAVVLLCPCVQLYCFSACFALRQLFSFQIVASSSCWFLFGDLNGNMTLQWRLHHAATFKVVTS